MYGDSDCGNPIRIRAFILQKLVVDKDSNLFTMGSFIFCNLCFTGTHP